jgi:diguanylate cyclase (GGDEF)-like protein
MAKVTPLPIIDSTGLLDEFISEPLAIYDAKDDTILYLNKAGKAIHHLTEKDYGRPCYEAIGGQSSKCPDCLGSRMNSNSGDVYRCLKHNEKIAQNYILQSCYLIYKGKLARAESIGFIPRNYSEEMRIRESLHFEELLNKASSLSSFSHGDEDRVTTCLRLIGDFFDASRAYVYEKQGSEFKRTYEWSAPDVGPSKFLPSVNANTYRAWFGFAFKDHKSFSVVSLDEFSKDNLEAKKRIAKDGVHSFILQPLYENDELSGFYGLDNPAHRDIEEYALSAFALNIQGMLSQANFFSRIAKDKETGLPTSEYFWIKVASLAALKKSPLILAKIDIAHFRSLISYYGADFEARLLEKAGSLILSYPNVLSASHYPQSDQFLVLFYDDEVGASKSIEGFANGLSMIRHNVSISFYVGFYKIVDPLEPTSIMDDKLSLAHYEARQLHNVPYVLYDDSLGKRNEKEGELLNSFSKALLDEDFLIFAQPKYDMSQQLFIGAESLVRWKKGNELMLPEEFIPVLEKYGLVSELDRYVFLHVITYLKKELEEGHKPLPIAINLSHLDFGEAGLASNFISMIDSYHIPHSLVQFEIAGDAFKEDRNATADFIKQCHQENIWVTIDEFGNGYSTFNYLKSVDVNELKLDYRSFKDVNSYSRHRALLSSLINLSHSLSIRLTIGSVATDKDASFLYSLGAYCVQGDAINEVMPLKDLSSLPIKKSCPFSSASLAINYDEIIDPKSEFYHLFDYSLSYMGVYKYVPNKELQVLLENASLRRDRGSDDGNGNELLSFSKEEQVKLTTYLNSLVLGEGESRSVDLIKNSGYRVRLRGLLLKKEDNYNTLFLESLSLSGGNRGDKSHLSFTREQMASLFDNETDAVFATTMDNKIAYFNKAFLSFFPSAKLGSSCHNIRERTFNCDECPIRCRQDRGLSIEKRGLRFYIHSSRIFIGGEEAGIARLHLLSNNEKTLSIDDWERIGRSIFALVESYTDINLVTGEFKHANRKTQDGSINFREGDKDDYLSYIKEEGKLYQSEGVQLASFFSLSNLSMLEKQGHNPTLLLKEKDKEIYKESRITFSKKEAEPHAMIYIKDATADHFKDTDSLTGLLNRKMGKKRVDDFLSMTHAEKSYLAIIDLDDFKSYNDKYGHPLGDKILVEVGKILANLGPGWRFASRLGGDEFSVFYSNETKPLDIPSFREDLSRRLAEVSGSLGLEEKLNGSAGLSYYPQEGFSFDDLYHKADEALYLIKSKKKLDR